ncbi:MAG: prolyl oligopeptidase family serine peptidase [Candidatus Aminicenantes bacterium]|nr:prolyl oligopeptidase family serine peptidase [Candidatus Aminicenantes bacterium]NIM82038.1 prolyl oligopeptidase family serine peptidase [Candidatus Aminicenantes bacterium]NIN21422.1 prolyl oligopeptidase family serine peptidase [Candidatus Aminicenantes bacterium]NIN45249.1 prolyl oligopeptidase family serine peptidase [Candidatus Aminicenantes bacterium]NIN88069.1 prolyl oligopeptidase family serine peptidase [Candidatus Aminicenantes bacterium]
MRFTNFKIPVFISLILYLFSIGLLGQGTLADYQRAEKFLRNNVEKLIFQTRVIPNWIKNTSRFWYKSNTREGKKFILINAKRVSRKPAFDHHNLAAALSRLLKKEYQPYALPFDHFEFVDKGKAITFNVEKQKLKCNLKTYECKKIEEEKKDPSISISPDKQWTAFVKNYNLFVKSAKTGEEIQLTSDGTEKYPYALSWDWYYLMNESDPSKTDKMKNIIVRWSPDSQKLVTYRMDYRSAKKLYLYQSTPDSGYRAQVWSYYRSLPGENKGTMFEYVIFDMESKKQVAVDVKPLHSTVNWHFPTWFKDSQRLYFYYYTRGYKKLILVEIAAETGKTRQVVEESSKTYMDTAKRFINILGEGSEVIWGSERDGWSHLYLYDWRTGQLKNQITRGEFVVRRIIHVDEKKRQVYFLANGRETKRDPYFQHLYRVNLDGTGLTLLTPENAEHWIRLSPDNKYIVDTYSRVDLPPVSVLRHLKNGRVILKLEKADIRDLLATGWKYPEPFTVKARDGKTDLYVAIFRPSNFDPTKKYPVIDSTYSGPHAVRTPKSFRRGCLNRDQSIAELGFIVVTIDGLGTANRSKAFHDFSYQNLGDIGALDHIEGFKQLASRYPYMDLSRVGIFGHSAGGYDAAHALLTHPGFYKVGVASAGNHDHQMAKAWWPEIFQGYPVGKHYVEQSNLTLAKNLQGKMLLVHGDMDNNVNPASTLRLAGELIKANKDFDLVIIPNSRHRLSNHPYFIRKLWDYFVQHLLGVQPPKYQITTDLSN